MNKKWIFGISFLILVIIYFSFFSKDEKDNTEIFLVKKGSVEKTLSVSGNYQPKNYVDLSFETPTLISWVGVKVGDEVKKGQVLAKIDRNSLVANMNEAQTSLEKAIEAEKLARRKWDDYKPEERSQIKKTVDEARFRLDSIKAQLSKGVLISPMDGVVTKQEARQGEVAQGVVTRIIGENNFEVEAEISEADVINIHEGQDAKVTFDALGTELQFSAKIKHIDPEAIPNRDVVDFKTTFEIVDKVDDSVRPGMTADIDILVAKKDNVDILPLRFVKRDDDGSYVFIQTKPARCLKITLSVGDAQNSKCLFNTSEAEVEKKYVKTGVESDDGNIEILSGVEEGDEVFLVYEDLKK